MTIAIITGASSGLGREYVRAVAEMMPMLDEIWLIARRKTQLVELAQSIAGRRFRILPYDLTDPAALRKMQGLLAREKPQVRLLINDAGAMHTGPVAAMPIADQLELIALHAVAPTVLARLVLPYMARGAAIINVTSIGAFTPSPNMVVYSASKAYLLAYTKGLHAELRCQGIHVLALAPGLMRTGQFSSTAPSRFNMAAHLPLLNMAKVARRSLTLVQRGRMVYTPHPFYKAFRLAAALIPDALLTYFDQV
ncbi:SDR family NAD(P)-dependent oxidoreductase [Schleiferilactobacillus harbinensis]|uniref:SDR family NAD(P)-dependent oxidoreductase n=1 Tax=Schleiferilactobacillus harbinensis TaxID=304207 RepID=UPI0039E86E07